MLVDQIERRGDPRIRTPIELEVSYRIEDHDTPATELIGWLTEISDGGARLRLERPHTPHTQLLISGLPDRPDQEAVSCSVRWVRKATAEAGYEIGVAFP